MTDTTTTPYQLTVLPISTLRVDVVRGPDAGKFVVGENDSCTIGTARDNDLVLTDSTVSRYHVELRRQTDGVLVIDHGSTNGVLCGPARLLTAVVPPGTTLELGATALRITDGKPSTVELHEGDNLRGLRGGTPVMRRLMARVERAAQAGAAVLLAGESGTGKEAVARALHELGPRSAAPFITVDCASLSPTLVESELFGHERGAFTGATARRLGAFERANGGTLFLDEIAELPQPLQATLLGVLERRRFRRVGGDEEISVDVRVISATHHDLRADVNQGSFRLDLFYRIAVVVIELPALRKHAADIPMLVEHFLRTCGHQGPVSEVIPAATMKSLCEYAWPGNVRELRNLVEATLAMGSEPLDGTLATAAPGDTEGLFAELLDQSYRDARAKLLTEFEVRYLRRLMERSQHNVAQAARLARMDRSYLNELLLRHGLRGGLSEDRG